MQRVVISDDQLRAVISAVRSKRWALEASVSARILANTGLSGPFLFRTHNSTPNGVRDKTQSRASSRNTFAEGACPAAQFAHGLRELFCFRSFSGVDVAELGKISRKWNHKVFALVEDVKSRGSKKVVQASLVALAKRTG